MVTATRYFVHLAVAIQIFYASYLAGCMFVIENLAIDLGGITGTIGKEYYPVSFTKA